MLEFTPADLARVDAQPLSRWLPVSGTVQPLRQATVKAKVSGDVRQVPVREGESVRAGQLLARIDTADLEAKLIERIGALESAKAQLAMAAKTQATNQQLLKQNFISQNAYDNSESSLDVSQGTRQVGGSAGAARPQRAARRRSPCPRSRASWRSGTCRPARRWRSIRRSSPSST